MRQRAGLARLLARDRIWSRAIARRVAAHPVLRPASRVAARLGDGAVWLGAGAAAWVLGPTATRALVALAALGAALTALAVLALKQLARRPRPHWAADLQLSSLPRLDAHAFPSGHAARAACIAACAAAVQPSLAPPLAAVAALIAAARVAVGAHHLLDVLAGIVLGLVCAAWAAVLYPLLPMRWPSLPG